MENSKNNPLHTNCNSDEHKSWDRRSFLKSIGLAGIGGSFMFGGMPMAYAKSSKLTNALTAIENDRVLLIIRLQGGNDGLNTIVPIYDYDTYANFRPTIKHTLSDTFKLTDDFGIPNYMNSLEPLWKEGGMKVVHGTGYENQNLSHFRGTDIWSTGRPDKVVKTGMYGRYFDVKYPDFLTSLPDAPPALQIGGIGDRMFQGTATNFAFTVSNTKQLEQIIANGDLYDVTDVPNCTKGKQLSFLRSVLNTNIKYSGIIKDSVASVKNTVKFPDTTFGKTLAIISRTIKANMGTKVYMVTLKGFDTHANQKDRHQELMLDLSSSISAFYEDLKRTNKDKKVLTMTFSEFGRRVKENNSRGTDHGAAAPMLVFGPAIGNSGFVGTHPDLSDLDRRGNLKSSIDYVDVFGSVMEKWLCIDYNIISKSIGREYKALNLGFNCSETLNNDVFNYQRIIHKPLYTSEDVFIQIQIKRPEDCVIRLYDLSGRDIGVTFSETISSGITNISIKKNFSNQLSGIYIYNISIGGKNYNKKIVIN